MRQWPCTICSKVFRSSNALAAHSARSHNVKNPARKLAFGTQCPSCLKEFHTRYRLIVHLAYRSPACHAIASIVLDPMADDEAERLDTQDRPAIRVLARTGRGAAFARIACCQALGPLRSYSYHHDAYDEHVQSISHYPPLRRSCDRKSGVTEWPITSSCAASLISECTNRCILCQGIRSCDVS